MEDPTNLIWRKSSYSGNGGGNCVEVATNLPGMVAVRDSKDRRGPKLILTEGAWSALVDAVKRGQFDL